MGHVARVVRLRYNKNNAVALSPRANYTDCDHHLSTKFSASFCG
jgi:hypothetical protein